MGLELATYIAQMDGSWPLSADLTSQGDDHLRLIKNVLQNQFPGAGGSGFSKQITASEDEINRLDGVRSNIQDQIDANQAFDPGTVMVFYQASAPTGWTKVTNRHDYMLRVISGTGGGAGGNVSPITMAHNHGTSGHTLTEAEMPSHRHYWDNGSRITGSAANGTGPNASCQLNPNVLTISSTTLPRMASEYVGGGGSHDHGSTQTGSVAVKYIDMILCEMN